MKPSRIAPVALALVLQVMPFSRLFIPALPSAGNSYAIVSTWIAGLAALMGGIDAVSGASTTITSPTTATATNGVAFSYRVTTGPEAANWFTASNLPPGLVISQTVGRITGVPTNNGVYVVLLTASDSQRPDRTVTANLTLTVKPVGGGIPVITAQPASTRTIEDSRTTFSVIATGPAPLRYLWRRNGAPLVGATNATYTVDPVSTNHAGSYTALVTSPYGSVLSSNATLTVISHPRFSSIARQGAQLQFGFTREPGAIYEVQFKDTLNSGTWTTWTNWPASTDLAASIISVSTSEAAARLFQIKMTLP